MRDNYSKKTEGTMIETNQNHKVVFIQLDAIVVRRLEEAFSNDYTNEQAALYAKISPEWLYRVFKRYPAFKEYLISLKDLTCMTAKKNISQAVARGDVDTSKWVLERRDSRNYGLKDKMDVNIKSKVIKSYLPDVDEKIEDGQRIDE